MGPGDWSEVLERTASFLRDPGLWDGEGSVTIREAGFQTSHSLLSAQPTRGAENQVACQGLGRSHPWEPGPFILQRVKGWSQEAQIPRLDKLAAFGVFEVGGPLPLSSSQMLLKPQKNTPHP